MGGYATMPAAWTPDDAGPWIERSLRFVAALPAKKAKSRPSTS
jgi:hypothetical protein